MATFEFYRDEQNEYRWRLCDAGDVVIAESGKGYKRKGACEGTVALVKLFAREAEVIDRTEPPTSVARANGRQAGSAEV